MSDNQIEINGPTPERIRHAANDNEILESGARRFKDDLVLRLYEKGGLYPDAAINRAMYGSAERYYADWYNSNMSGIASFDPTRVFCGGGSSGCGMPAGQFAAQARDSYRKAREALGAKYRPVVEAVVLQGQIDLVAIGHVASGAASKHTCRAVAMERLCAGLYVLAKHYQAF